MQLSIEIPENIALQLQTLENRNEFIYQAILKALEQNLKTSLFKMMVSSKNFMDTHIPCYYDTDTINKPPVFVLHFFIKFKSFLYQMVVNIHTMPFS
jgi:hypothetical protein